jgi:DNA-binding NarL/FixJ family response regulator
MFRAARLRQRWRAIQGATVQRIRVLLAEMPRMLRELVEPVLATDPDIVVVGAVDSRDALEVAVRALEADVVLVAMPSDEQAESYARLLFDAPRTTLLAITHDGRDAFLYALRPHKMPIGEVSRSGILAAIHDACRATV